MNALLIINPISGTRGKDEIPGRLSEALSGRGVGLDVVETQGPHHGYDLARQAVEEGRRVVITAGGDGTVNEVASALCGTETALGIIPCGSGNGLARTIGLPPGFDRAIEVIARGDVLRCDHGRVNDVPFFCTFGVGFDAAVTEKFAQEKRRGKTTYIKSVMREFVKYSPGVYALEIEGNVIQRRAFLIAVCNTSQYGNNAYIAPRASITDGLLDVVVVHGGNPLATMICGIDMLTGYLDRNILIESFRVSRACITKLDDSPAQVDGEPLDLGRRMEVVCDPASLRLIVPGELPPFRPLLTPLASMIEDVRNDIRSDVKRILGKI